MAFPGDVANHFPRDPVSPFDLELETILEDHEVSWQVTDEMLALELETHRRCFPPQPALSALQRFKGRKCAFFLCGLAATVDLPPHSAFFSLQLMDLTHIRHRRQRLSHL